MTKSTGAKKNKNELLKIVNVCWTSFRTVGLFSLAINILMLTMPVYMLQIYDRVVATGHVETLIALTVIATIALLVLGVLDMLRTVIGVRTGCWFERRLAPIFLTCSVHGQLNGHNAGVQPLRDLAEIRAFLSSPSLNMLFDAPWVPVFVVLIWLVHPTLGVLAVSGACMLLALSFANDLLTRPLMKDIALSSIRATQQADAAVRNAEVIGAMGMLPAVIGHWQHRSAEALDGSQKAGERAGIMIGMVKFLRFAMQMGMLGLGAYLVLRNEITPGSMIAGSILLGRALAPVEMAMSAWRTLTSARLAYGRLSTFIQEVAVPEPRMSLPAPAGRIAVHDLTYFDPVHKLPILKRITFEVNPGEVLAVIGPSGAGKSTLCRMLVGVARPSAGAVRIDGSDINHWDAAQLGRFIGFLPQGVELFAGTICENISRLAPESDEAVVAAAKLAHAHEMIQSLPKGYNTEMGDAGARLSGGQRQRIGLARAVFGDPRVIVMDEPNANLDPSGEAALAAAIAELKTRNTALIIIGHRPSTLAQADNVLVLKEGQVGLFGPRDEVLQQLRKPGRIEDATATKAGGSVGAAHQSASKMPVVVDDSTLTQRSMPNAQQHNEVTAP